MSADISDCSMASMPFGRGVKRGNGDRGLEGGRGGGEWIACEKVWKNKECERE